MTTISNNSDCQRRVVVFLGPTLPVAVARRILPATYLPPARFGDVYQLIGSPVHTIVLIDGNFHQVCAVWQRELLAALNAGIRVIGCSSMGALRAAELYRYGMEGVGVVFAMYRDGLIDGDDEVALLHAGAKHNFQALSTPLVNIRVNLERAVAEGVLGASPAAELLAATKAAPFWERDRDQLLRHSCLRDLDQVKRARLLWLLGEGARDLKKEDALTALRSLSKPRPPQPAAIEASPYHMRTALLRRRRPNGVSVAQLLKRLFEDRGLALACKLFFNCRFFALRRLADFPETIPRPKAGAHGQARVADVFLHDNLLTAAEYSELEARSQQLTWLLEACPAALKPPPLSAEQRTFLTSLIPPSVGEALALPTINGAVFADWFPFANAWVSASGARPSAKEAAALMRRRHLPDGQQLSPQIAGLWALHKGPVFFGYHHWSVGVATLREIQYQGKLALLCSRAAQP